MSESTTTTTPTPTILTYRLNDKLVYVAAAETYEEGLNNAYEVFPTQLRGVRRENVSFYVNVVVQRVPKAVCIGHSAWPQVIRSLVNYEIIDVVIEVESAESKVDVPPAYSCDTKDAFLSSESEKTRQSSHSRTPSPNPSSSSASKGKWLWKH